MANTWNDNYVKQINKLIRDIQAEQEIVEEHLDRGIDTMGDEQELQRQIENYDEAVICLEDAIISLKAV